MMVTGGSFIDLYYSHWKGCQSCQAGAPCVGGIMLGQHASIEGKSMLVDITSTGPACEHDNGWFDTVPGSLWDWLFSRRRTVFVCEDCARILDEKTLQRV